MRFKDEKLLKQSLFKLEKKNTNRIKLEINEEKLPFQKTFSRTKKKKKERELHQKNIMWKLQIGYFQTKLFLRF